MGKKTKLSEEVAAPRAVKHPALPLVGPDRAPCGSCKHCGSVLIGHFTGCPAARRDVRLQLRKARAFAEEAANP